MRRYFGTEHWQLCCVHTLQDSTFAALTSQRLGESHLEESLTLHSAVL